MKNKKITQILLLSILSVSLLITAMFLQAEVNSDEKIKGDSTSFILTTSGYENPIEINATAIGVGANNWSWAKDQSWCTGSGIESDPYIIENLIIDSENIGNCIAIYNSEEHFIVRNCTVYNSGSDFWDAGIRLENVTNAKLINNSCLNNTVGIHLEESSFNFLLTNHAFNNTYYGIYLRNKCGNNVISENILNNNSFHGIAIWALSETYNCKDNTISRNIMSNNQLRGIFLTESDNNEITENYISNNSEFGIYLLFCHANNISKNYFIENSIHAKDESDPGFPDFDVNNWDNSIIGNYWDNYTGSDSNDDGIGEEPYSYILSTFVSPNDTLPIYGDPFHKGEKIHIDGSGVSGHNWAWASTRAWCSGSGALNDPYVISDLIIDAANDESCILIGNSSVDFKIENSTLSNSGSGSMDAGIKLDSVDNAQLIGNNCSNNQCGISLYLSDNNNITENTLQKNYYGVCLNDSDSNTITENTFDDNTEYALEENSVGNTFENNYCIPPLTITNVTSTDANDTYRFGETIEITIEFSDIVYVTGTPQLSLETGDDDAVVDYTSGNETDTLSFNYTVDMDHYSTDLDYISTDALDLNGGTIKGIVRNDANITLSAPGTSGSLGSNKNIIVDAKTPSINNVSSTKPNGFYTTGEEINITVTFSEPVFVTGTPTLTLETNSIPDGIAYYTSGNETATLTFTYTVVLGHYSSDLDYDSTNALNGIIKDSDELVADLTLSVPGTAGSLGDNKDLLIDTIDPSSPGGLAAVPSSWTNTNDFDLSWSNPADTSGIAGAYYKLYSAPTSDTDGTYEAGVGITSITGITVGSEGAHTVYVWLRDAAGNVDYTTYDSVVLSLDTTDPSSPGGLAADPSSWTNTNDFDLSWSNPADLSGIAGAYYKLYSAPTSDTDGTYEAGVGITSITGITVGSDGAHTVYIWLRDAAGNVDYTTYDSVVLSLDTTDPSSPSGLAAVPSSWTSTDDFDLSWSNPADLSGIAGAYYKLYSAPTSDTDGTYEAGAGITSITGITVGSEGAHTVYVWLRDTVGNVDYTTYDSVVFSLDTTDPSSPGGLAAVPSSWTSTNDFDLSWSNPSELSGIAGAYYKLYSAPTSDTDGTYEAGAGITSITGITVGSEGAHTVYVWLRDAAGNVDYTTYVSVELYLDTTDPSSLSGLAADPSSWTSTNDFDLSWSNPTDLSGIAGAYYKLYSAPTSDTDGTYEAGAGITSITGIIVGSDGAHTVYVWLRDAAGNVDYTTYDSVVFSLDTTDPSSPSGLTADPSSWTSTNDFDLTWSNPADLSGIAGAYYKLYSAPTSDTEGTYEAGAGITSITGITVGSDGTHTVYVWLRDAVGNVDYTTYVSVELYLDTTDPSSPGGLAADPSSWTSTNDFDLSWSNPSELSGIAGAYYKLYSAPTSDTDGTYEAGAGITSITGITVGSDGTHTVYVWLRDAVGNVDYMTYVSVELYLDTTDPSSPSGLAADPSSWTSINDFDLTWSNPADLSGITGVYYKLDSAPTSDTDGTYEAGTGITSITGITVGSDGAHTVYVWLRDAAGNVDYTNHASTQLYLDITDPSVLNVSSSNSDGSYGIDDDIYIIIVFSEPVFTTGIPQLILETGSTDAIIYYTSGNETDTLVFTYTVISGHNSTDLEYSSTNALSGTIKDVVGNAADLTLAAPGTSGSLGYNKDIIIETTPPEVTSVSSSEPDGTYGTGEIINIMVTFSEPVYVTGIPQLTLETGSIDAVINYISGSGTDTLTFSYIVASGHTSSDLGYESMNALSLNGGTIRDLAGNGANVTLPTPGSLGSLSDNKDIILETISPTITSVSSTKPDGTYGDGETIDIIITFSESVYVTGTPQLTLETGSTDAIISYTSGSGTATLIFTYVVASGDNSEDLDYESVNALSLNGGSIKDSVGNDAVLTLPAPGTGGSLSFNKDLIIETVVEPDPFVWIVIIGSGSVIGLSIIIYLVVRKKRRAK